MKYLLIVIALLAVAAPTSYSQDQITYDSDLRIKKIRYSNGQETTYEYDARGNITAINDVVASVEKTNVTKSNIVIRPNPARDVVTIEADAPAGGKARFSIFSVDGKRVFSDNVLPSVEQRATLELNVQQLGLATGTYQVVVETKTGKSSAPITIVD